MSKALRQIEAAVGSLDADENQAALVACLEYALLDDIVGALKTLPSHDLDEIVAALESR